MVFRGARSHTLHVQLAHIEVCGSDDPPENQAVHETRARRGAKYFHRKREDPPRSAPLLVRPCPRQLLLLEVPRTSTSAPGHAKSTQRLPSLRRRKCSALNCSPVTSSLWLCFLFLTSSLCATTTPSGLFSVSSSWSRTDASLILAVPKEAKDLALDNSTA